MTITNVVIFLAGLILTLACLLVIGSFALSIFKLYFRDYCRIMMEEKVKAYSVLLDGLFGKMTVSAMREQMGQVDSTTKPN